MTIENDGQPPFDAHVELLRLFVADRKAIVERLQDLLNAQRKPVGYLQDRTTLFRLIEDCFYSLASLSDAQARLRGRLQQAHWASGFSPRQVPGLFNDLINPAEMMIRGFYLWQQTRWPGRNGRVRYAHMLFNLYLLRCLQFLSLRSWVGEAARASDRMAEAQSLLDALWSNSPTDLPVLVRDARWLIPLAQSPTTDELSAYFEVAESVAETLAASDRLEVQKAHVVMLGGHLRSQMRHYCIKESVSLDDKSVVLRTRKSNALDFALLIQCLVPLLEAYERAIDAGDEKSRLELATGIGQGISPDPELFLNRVDLLAAYSMIEHLFIESDDEAGAVYTPMGRRHRRLIEEYEPLIERLATPLHEDYSRFRPVEGSYSPLGAIFGTPTNLIEDTALKSLQRNAATNFRLEDVFTDGDATKLDWVNGWKELPHVSSDVQALYQYPHRFAEAFFDRIDEAFRRHLTRSAESKAPEAGRLHVVVGNDQPAGSKVSDIPDLPVEFVGSSDTEMVNDERAFAYERARLLRDRLEGYFVASFEMSDGWVAVSKDILTEELGAGREVKLTGLPPAAASVLKLMCPDKVVVD